ncbi:hypothetical protein CsSME_00018395 [Camellia sinensis var. sinensis]
MAMAMRLAAARVAPAGPLGLRTALFSTLTSSSPFVPPPTNQAERPPPAEPSTNLFVSGLSKRTTTEGLREAFAKFGEVVHGLLFSFRILLENCFVKTNCYRWK